MARKTTNKAAARKTTKRAIKEDTVLYIRSLPVEVATKIKRVAKSRRQTTAGVIMGMVDELGENYFDTSL